MCRLLPRSHGLPRFPGGSASASSLSRPPQASRALRPAELLNRPRRPLSRGFDQASCPARPLVSYQINRQLSGWNLPPLVIRAFRAHWEMWVKWWNRYEREQPRVLLAASPAKKEAPRRALWKKVARHVGAGSGRQAVSSFRNSRVPTRIGFVPALPPFLAGRLVAPLKRFRGAIFVRAAGN